MARVLGVLAGRDMPLEQLREWTHWADVILAADSAADRLAEIGVSPDVTIGDFDSIESHPEGFESIHDPSQESTDCDKLLWHAIALGHTEITLASIEGDRLDHMLATLHSAAKHPIDVRVALRTGVGWILCGPIDRTIETSAGQRVSLIPLSECQGVSIEGVAWPLQCAELHPIGLTSISNQSLEARIRVAIQSGIAFLYLGT